jgi:hypothetical protein
MWKKEFEQNNPRPSEPYSTSEKPEEWAAIVSWSEEYIAFLETILKEELKKRTKEVVNELIPIINLSHRYCDDSWYSCPKHPEGCSNDDDGDDCNCGAVDRIKKLEELKQKYGIKESK